MPAKKGFSERAWEEIINAGTDGGWIDSVIEDARRDPNGPFADVGPLLSAMLQKGVSREDIGRFARWMKYNAVFATTALAGEMKLNRSLLDSIHEELLIADPSGLDGRPGSWPIPERQRSTSWPLELPKAEHVAFRPDSSHAWLASTSITATTLHCVELPSGDVVAEVNSLPNLRGITCSRDGRLLAVSNHDGAAAVHDAISGKLLWKSPKTREETSSLSVTPDGSTVLVSGSGSAVRRYDGESGKALAPLDLGKGWLAGRHALSADGRVLVLDACRPGLEDDHLVVWDCATATELARHPLARPVSTLELLPDGETVLTCGYGGVSTWSLRTQRVTPCFEVEGVREVRLHPAGRLIGVLAYERMPEIRAFPSGEVLHAVEREDASFANEWSFSADGRFAVLANAPRSLAWDLPALLEGSGALLRP